MNNRIWKGVIDRYQDFLPVTPKTPIVTLLEGNTPLLPALEISKKTNCEVFLKLEGLNPTGSFKDRGMTVAVSKALEEGANAVMCASTGNTSASAAAYAAKAGIASLVFIPEGNIALGKLAQALMHGAVVVALEGNFDVALSLVRKIAEEYEIALVNSLNPYRLEGQKTAAFEIIDVLLGAPDYLFIPVGNAGNITAYWKGFLEYFNKKLSSSLPKMVGWQAAGAAPIVLGYPIDKPETFATAIRIGNPARWKEAKAAAKDSGGMIGAVTDEEIRAAYELLASSEGVFGEPASAASVAGLIKACEEKMIEKGSRIVCIITGHGLKDPDSAVKHSEKKLVKLKADNKVVFNFIENVVGIRKRKSNV